MEYTVIRALQYIKLLELVNRHIADGWSLQGGVCVSSGRYEGYYQAMTRAKATDQ